MAVDGLRVEIVVLASAWARLRGLLGRPAPEPGRGVWISPCRQVHTFFMAYAIDVIFLDRDRHVIAVDTMRPWRLGRYVFRARGALEMRAGEAARLGIEKGVTLDLVQTPPS